ncbi:hypothetical protein BGX38DRAFT_63158 [Terfezia claveryi]|nr:hypothetical protein BGX38DRAFT_63158 [Terfezia claveryi]
MPSTESAQLGTFLADAKSASSLKKIPARALDLLTVGVGRTRYVKDALGAETTGWLRCQSCPCTVRLSPIKTLRM